MLGKTGLKVTTVGFGCMITADGSVIERAADVGINYFDTARSYPDVWDVADVLRYLMYAGSYGQFALGREECSNFPAQLASVRCADCPECTVQCVNGVQVVERLSRAQEWFA